MSDMAEQAILIDCINIGDSVTAFPALYELANSRSVDLWFRNQQVSALWGGPHVTLLQERPSEGRQLGMTLPSEVFMNSGLHMIQAWFWHLGMRVPSEWPSGLLAKGPVAQDSIDVIISPYSLSGTVMNQPWKIWIYDQWNVVIDTLLAAGYSVGVCGSFVDGTDYVFWKCRPIQVLDKLPLLQLVSHLRAARCVVTIDNGIGHIAHLAGVPHAQLVPVHPSTCPFSWVRNHCRSAASVVERFDILEPARVLEMIFAVISRFNGRAYLEQNPDVTLPESLEPWKHWISNGRREGRDLNDVTRGAPA